ncbi:glycosyltransferase family 4 protein [Brevibacterium daeguense]|uniref:Glycosyltransferase family 4 protein n=1 Tax=Brevibacterium daeguense TaxID=909936 RepID=A0ABP8EHC7_9MICO|nr:glycosyltransferase family 4 protein [Brevibacterium daeguense]
MSASFVFRQAVTLSRVIAEHVTSDPVFFGMQASRRLPRMYSKGVGRLLSKRKHPAVQATGLWLGGDLSEARKVVRAATGKTRGISARVLGEIALHVGMRDEAEQFAAVAGTGSGARALRARIAGYLGDMTGSIAAAPRGRPRSRLESERAAFARGWYPAVTRSRDVTQVPKADVVFSLTNSLPHTQSGYTLRTHAILQAVQGTGVGVLGTTRTSYPVSVGRFSWRDHDIVDGVTYVRDVPWNHGRTVEERIEKQAEFLAGVARGSDAKALHTTTHFVNGVATRAAAEHLGLPWIYEVRGVLEETWAAGRGTAEENQAVRGSERFSLFRDRETEVALAADRVITLGQTMAAELVRRGVNEDKILVAPNAVSASVLQADVSIPAGQVRAEQGLPRDGVWVGTAASIVGYEGLDVLVDAVEKVRSAGVDLRLLVVGDGVELPALREQARPLGAAAVFTGRVPQSHAHSLVRCLDVFVVPRRDDPVCSLVTPLKPVEAAGFGRPVVLSDLPALTESLPPGAFISVPPGDACALADTLTWLGRDEDTRAALAAAGRDFVRRERRWDGVGRAYAELYEGLGLEVGGSL